VVAARKASIKIRDAIIMIIYFSSLVGGGIVPILPGPAERPPFGSPFLGHLIEVSEK